MREFRLITAASTGQLRTASFQGREHLIVPVVALVEGVLHAVNSASPELVLAEEFKRAPQGWNGRPVMMDHPSIDGIRVSANNPALLEQSKIGTIFNTAVKNNKLAMEAWIDVGNKVEGSDEVIARMRAGETIEVSVGCFVDDEVKEGSLNGKQYSAIWRNIVPDHLAILKDSIGACSVAMGCGAMRAAKGGDVALKSWFFETLEKFRPSQAAVSDSELRNSLEELLRSIEPVFLGVDAVYSSEKDVVYAVAPDKTVRYFKRGYTLSESGELSVSDDRIEVTPKTTFEPVKAAEGTTETTCKCHDSEIELKTQEEKVMAVEVTPEKKARAIAIANALAAQNKVFSAADATLIESWPEDRLVAMEKEIAAAAPAAPVAAPAAAPAPVAAPAVVVAPAAPAAVVEGYTNDEVREIVNQHKAAQQAAKTKLVNDLKAAQSAYSESDLQKMDVPNLEKIAQLALGSKRKVDFSGNGAPRAAETNDDENVIPPTPSVDTFLKAAKKSA